MSNIRFLDVSFLFIVKENAIQIYAHNSAMR